MFSPNKIQGMTGGHGLGGVYGLIKSFGSTWGHNFYMGVQKWLNLT